MSNDSSKDLVQYITQDVLADVGLVSTRAMFGGHGLYFEGRIFGIEANGEIYFKVTDVNREDYEKAGSAPFHYSSKDKGAVTMSYWKVPDDILEDRDAAVMWARKAIRASWESKAKKPSRGKNKK
ncbi:TfoX/Sxy family protein [Patescibacteria group bacterium]|nr:TfoX/Sxy family protein [Patescibacteria group bacterium]